MDEQYFSSIESLSGLLLEHTTQLDAHDKRLLQHALILSRHDSEITSVLAHDHTHQVEAAPDSNAATVL